MVSSTRGGEVLVAITVDVEEEGLFGGRHGRRPKGLANVPHLRRLAFLTRSYGLPLTLLATYPVLQDPACREELLSWRENLAAEIGAHLHVWNTPPFAHGEPWQAHLLPASLQAAKLERLLKSHAQALGQPARSFRMGRFELTQAILSRLPHLGIQVDSSLVPLHWPWRQAPHFLTPADPHPLPGVGAGALLTWEAPLTVLPLWPAGALAAHRLAQVLPARAASLGLDCFRYLAAVGVQPTMYSGAVMRLAARTHLGRGGRVLTMFLHSSELMPGGSPAYPSARAVDGLVGRIARFLDWLNHGWPVRGITLGQLPAALAGARGEAP